MHDSTLTDEGLKVLFLKSMVTPKNVTSSEGTNIDFSKFTFKPALAKTSKTILLCCKAISSEGASNRMSSR